MKSHLLSFNEHCIFVQDSKHNMGQIIQHFICFEKFIYQIMDLIKLCSCRGVESTLFGVIPSSGITSIWS